MFETMVPRWVAIILVSHIPCYLPFDIQIVASPLSLACVSKSFFLIALLTFLHQDRGPLVYACFIMEFHEPWAYGCIFLSLFFLPYHHTIAFHHMSLVVYFISSSLFYLLVLLYILFTLSGDPPQFITWRIVTSLSLFIPRRLIQRPLVWEGHLVRESFC